MRAAHGHQSKPPEMCYFRPAVAAASTETAASSPRLDQYEYRSTIIQTPPRKLASTATDVAAVKHDDDNSRFIKACVERRTFEVASASERSREGGGAEKGGGGAETADAMESDEGKRTDEQVTDMALSAAK